MEKAYDIKALGEMIIAEAKVEGLTIAEEAVEALAKAAYKGQKKWMKESALLSENKIDDVLIPFYDLADSIVLPLIEKVDIDGDGK